jgi:hypothetical protein
MTIYQLTHKMRWLGQEVRNIFYYETTVGNPSTSEFQDMVDEIRADLVAELIASLSPDWAFYALAYRIVSSAGLLSFDIFPTAGEIVGTSGSDDLATQIAMLVSVKGTTTKPNRARTYLAGFVEAVVIDSLFNAASQLAAEVFIDLQSDLNAGGTNPLVRMAAQWNSSHTQVIVTNNISGDASKASQVPATQRRRRIGVGI